MSRFFKVADTQVHPLGFDVCVVIGFVNLYVSVSEDLFGNELVDECEFVVVSAGHLVTESRIAADMIAISVFLELFGDGIGAEEADVGDLGFLIIH